VKLDEALARAEQVGWLAEQPARFRAGVLKRCRLRPLQVGTPLYVLGDPPGGVWGLVDGFVDVLLAVGPGSPFLVHIGRPGWWVGEAAAATRTTRRVDVRARTAVHALYLSPKALSELAEEDASAWRCFATLSVAHLDNALSLAVALAPGSVRSKVLATLIRLAGPPVQVDDVVELPCKQSEIAEMTGLTRNSVGPVMRQLIAEGLIEARRNRISYNPTRIKRAMEG
jgi:CRP/FNR family cyclic AMP-dependent transcriptional regulator